MAKKTLYVPDEDEPTWKLAEELSETSISKLVTQLLKKEVEVLQRMEALSERMERQIIEATEQWGARRQSFVGCWLVTNEPLGDQFGSMCSVAITRKNQFLVYETCDHGNTITIYPDFDKLAASTKLPASIKQLVSDQIGADYIEELDI